MGAFHRGYSRIGGRLKAILLEGEGGVAYNTESNKSLLTSRCGLDCIFHGLEGLWFRQQSQSAEVGLTSGKRSMFCGVFGVTG